MKTMKTLNPCILRDREKNPNDGDCHRDIRDGTSILRVVVVVRKDRPKKAMLVNRRVYS